MTKQERKPGAVVVNDDPALLRVLADLLGKAGMVAHAFSTAESALDAMDPADPPGLVVTDLNMPGIDGWRFCRLLRSPEYSAFNEVPILIVSATFAGDQPGRVAADAGADAFLPAPVVGEELVGRAQALLAGKEARRVPRALIVENDERLAGLLQSTFAANGYRADTALTACEAQAAFAKTPHDVAVLDSLLPDGAGDALLDAFLARRPDCVCLMVTGDPSPQLALDWMKRGAAAHLHKPFEPETLIELCARARRERALQRTANLLEDRTRELRESEEKFRLLVTHSYDLIWILKSDGLYSYASPSWKAVLGYEPSSAVGKGFQSFVHPDDVAVCEHYLARVLDAKKSLPGPQYRARHADGSWRWHEGRVSPVYSDDGSFIHFVGVSRDITERKQADEAIRASERRFHQLLQNATTTAVQGYTMDGTVRYWNRASETFYGYTEEEALGRNLVDLIIPPDMRDQVKTGIRRAGETGQVHPPCELALMRKDGSLIPVYSSQALVQVPGQEPELFCIDTDLTALKEAEAEREQLQAQIAQAQKMESVGRLAGGVAHDFNNVLQAILGHAEMALEQVGAQAPLLKADLEAIVNAAQHSANLTRQLLAFARKQTIAPKALDLNAAVEGMLKMLRRLIGEDIALAWQPAQDLWPVKMDPTQIDNILVNLCVNARDAIANVGTITIETGNAVLGDDRNPHRADVAPGDYVLLAVGDDGCGMDDETLSHLFEPFFTTKDQDKGTGLGLATVHGAVMQNKGFIDVASEPGRGTVVRIYLPRHAAEAQQQAEKSKQQTAAQGHETVLLVEDEPVILRMAKRMLERLSYTVLAATTPEEAIRIAGEHPGRIDLLMTDVVMPEMNGRDLAKSIVSIYPHIKTLFMSGYTADVIGHQGVLDEGVHFLEKPFKMEKLGAKLREALG